MAIAAAKSQVASTFPVFPVLTVEEKSPREARFRRYSSFVSVCSPDKRYDPNRAVATLLKAINRDPLAAILHRMEPFSRYQAKDLLNSGIGRQASAWDLQRLERIGAIEKFQGVVDGKRTSFYRLTVSGEELFRPAAIAAINFVRLLRVAGCAPRYDSMARILGERQRPAAVFSIIKQLVERDDSSISELQKGSPGLSSNCIDISVRALEKAGFVVRDSAYTNGSRGKMNHRFSLESINGLAVGDDNVAARLAAMAANGRWKVPTIYVRETIELFAESPNRRLDVKQLERYFLKEHDISEVTAHSNAYGVLSALCELQFLKRESGFVGGKRTVVTPLLPATVFYEKVVSPINKLADTLDIGSVDLPLIAEADISGFVNNYVREKGKKGTRPGGGLEKVVRDILRKAGEGGMSPDAIATEMEKKTGRIIRPASVRRRYLTGLVRSGEVERNADGTYMLSG